MSLTTPNIVLEKTNFPQELVKKLGPHIQKAERRMRQLIGDDLYDDLNTRAANDPDRQRATHAESLLAVYFAFPFWNLRPTTRGGFVKATGIDQGPNQSRNELMGKAEMERYRYSLYQQALELIADMVIQEEDNLEGPVSMIAL